MIKIYLKYKFIFILFFLMCKSYYFSPPYISELDMNKTTFLHVASISFNTQNSHFYISEFSKNLTPQIYQYVNVSYILVILSNSFQWRNSTKNVFVEKDFIFSAIKILKWKLIMTYVKKLSRVEGRKGRGEWREGRARKHEVQRTVKTDSVFLISMLWNPEVSNSQRLSNWWVQWVSG